MDRWAALRAAEVKQSLTGESEVRARKEEGYAQQSVNAMVRLAHSSKQRVTRPRPWSIQSCGLSGIRTDCVRAIAKAAGESTDSKFQREPQSLLRASTRGRLELPYGAAKKRVMQASLRDAAEQSVVVFPNQARESDPTMCRGAVFPSTGPKFLGSRTSKQLGP